MNLRSVVTLETESCNRAKLLDAALTNGITLYSVSFPARRKMTVSVSAAELSLLLSVCSEIGLSIEEKSRSGISRGLKKLLPRLPLALTLSALWIAYAVLQGFIWRIEITGNAAVTRYAIERALAENGFSIGEAKDEIDLFAAETALRKVNGIAEAAVKISGTTLKVNVLESLAYRPPTVPEKPVLISLYDAEVTRLVVRKGTALVKKGQKVFSGAPLVTGSVIGADGEIKAEGKADADVYGITVLSLASAVPLTRIKFSETGRTHRAVTLSFFGLKTGDGDSPFEFAERKARKQKLFPLPITVTETFERELSQETVTVSLSEAAETAEKALLEKAAERLVGGVIRKSVTVKEVGGVAVVRVFLSVEIKINN